MRLNLIEKEYLPRLWMTDDRRTNLSSPQIVFPPPLKLDLRSSAIVLYCRPVCSAEERLPANIQTLSVVSDIHQSLIHKPFYDPWMN